MSDIDSKPLENLARASLAQDREIATLRKQLSNVRDELSFVTTEHNAVLDVLIAADMWTGNPPYRGVSAAGQVQMILDALAAVTAERDRLKAQLDAVPVKAIEVLRKEAIDEEWERQALRSDGPDGRHLAEIDVWLGLKANL